MTLRPRGSWWTRPRCAAASAHRTSWPRSWPTSAGVARLPNVTIQVVPNIAHAGLLGGFAVAERAAYVETAVAGQVFEDAEIIAGLLTRFDTLRNEAFRGSESLTLIERMCEEWTAAGARAATQAANGGECVEVATAGAVLVRDTADRGGPVLTFTADAWRAFTATIR